MCMRKNVASFFGFGGEGSVKALLRAVWFLFRRFGAIVI